MEHGNNGKGERKTYKILVDNRPFEMERPTVTGAQIKMTAGVSSTFGLMYEGRGQAADRAIGDEDLVDLSGEGREHFYSVPPATFGGAA